MRKQNKPAEVLLPKCLAVLAVITTAAIAFPSGVAVFEDTTASSKLSFRNEASHTSRKYLPESMVGGVAFLDYDNDGKLDLFFVIGARLSDPMPPGTMPDKSDPKYWDRLYRNNGDGSFRDVTEQAGVKGRYYGKGV